MVHQPVYQGGRQLVVIEHGAAPVELDAGGDDHAAPLVAVRHHLEQQARPLSVDGHVAELVDDHQVAPVEILEKRLQPVLAAGLGKRQHEVRSREEPHGPRLGHAGHVGRDRQMGLAPSRLAVEHEVLGRVDECERFQALARIPRETTPASSRSSQTTSPAGTSPCAAAS